MDVQIAVDKIESLFGDRLWDTCYCEAWQTLKSAVLGTTTNYASAPCPYWSYGTDGTHAIYIHKCCHIDRDSWARRT